MAERKKHKSKGNKKRPVKPDIPDRSRTEENMRLNKFIAHSGICSRRQAAEYVKKGKVQVNGAVLTDPSYQVQPDDEVRYEGEVVRPERRKVYFLMNKPKDVITTVKDERGRKTVMELLKRNVKERVFPVGRLDRNSTGLLLLTNDGDLAKKLTHPSHKVKKIYHVMLDKPLAKADLDRILAGDVQLEDGPVQFDGVEYVQGQRAEVGIELHTGRNRIIRRTFEQLGYEIKKLDRVFFGGLTKKDLPRGFYRRLTEREVIMLKHFV